MIARSSLALPVLMLSVVAGLSFWLNQLVQENSGARHLRPNIDFTVDQLQAADYNVDGFLRYHLQAKRLEHYPDQKLSVLDQIQLVQYQPQQPTVHVQAQRGRMLGEGETVHLDGWVHLQQDASAQNPALTLQTSQVLLQPKLGLARSDAAVELKQGPLWVQAVGFDVDQKNRVIRLHSQVKAVYANPHVKK